MAQKVEFMFNDLVDAADPTDEELEQFLRDHSDKFMESARTSFTHIYLNADKRDQTAEADAQQLLETLNSNQGVINPAATGDNFMFGYTFENQSDHQVSRIFGNDFTQSLANLKANTWQGPVVSGYGLHLVYITERKQAWLPPLSDIRDTVLFELLAERRKSANMQFYETLRERYDIIVEMPEAKKLATVEQAQ
jgi:hypothetical protein